MTTLIQRRKDYLHTRKVVRVTSVEITSWFKKFLKMVQILENPTQLKKYDKSNVVKKLPIVF